MSRRKARVLACQALYCWEAARTPLEELLKFDWEEERAVNIKEDTRVFASNLIAGTIEKVEEIDGEIKKYLRNWKIERIRRVDLAVLRVGVYSLLFQKEIPAAVVIEEAVDICREFSGEKSGGFVNGVLDNIQKEHSPAR